MQRNVYFQKGLTLIEVLITLFVLSVGLLGIAKMQIMALQGSHSAFISSLASIQTEIL